MIYFQGWRRNLGGVTLLMACVLVGLWVRSIGNEDRLEMYPGSSARIHLDSFHGTLGWQFTDLNQLIPPVYRWQLEWTRKPVAPEHHYEIGPPRQTRWTWRYLGIDVRWQQTPRHAECYVRYLSIVIPLTVLAAWLLFSKPRVAKQ